MFNVTVLRMKDILKYLFEIIVAISIIVYISTHFNKNTKEKKIVGEVKSGINLISQKNMISSLDYTVPAISEINKQNNTEEDKDEEKNKDNEREKNKSEKTNIFENIINTQLSAIEGIEKIESSSIETANNNSQELNSNENLPEESRQDVEPENPGVNTEIVTNNPIKETYNVTFGKVKIKNQTDYQLTEEMMRPDIKIENKNVLIFHTHSCESYTPSEKYQYNQTGTFRTTDLNFTVARVGGELENQLKVYNIKTIHNTDYHDYPSYNGSYTRSLSTVENILKTNKSDIIIDLHRDAIGARSDYAPCVKIGENDIAAQIMFVIGTNNGGLWHPNWDQNLKFAIKVQEKAEEMYPGLFKPIMLTKSRYNQHTGKYANIIEVGATGNTLDQCLTSMKYLAKVMDEILK